MTQAELHALLYYDAESGCFFWKCNKGPRAQKGMRAGTRRSDGYRCIRLNNIAYTEHRLAWLYMTGSFPEEGIDHVNDDKADNRWENLRAATQAQNNHNRPTGNPFRGTFKHKNNWGAAIRVAGKTVHLGTFPDRDLAAAAYTQAAQQYYSDFARVD